jgi:hypothetical protein
MAFFAKGLRHVGHYFRIAQAWGYLLLFKALIRFVDFSKWAVKGKLCVAETLHTSTPLEWSEIHKVLTALRRAIAWLPIKSVCLDQALCVQVMLKKKGILTTVYVGMRHEEGQWKSHAWVRYGDCDIWGTDPSVQYTIVSSYVLL